MKKLFMMILTVLSVAVFASSDMPKGHWAYDAVNTLYKKGILAGYTDDEFKGNKSLSRYELAMVIANILPRLNSSDKKCNCGCETGKTCDCKDCSCDSSCKESLATKSDLDSHIEKEKYISGDDNLVLLVKEEDLQLINKLVNEFKVELDAIGIDGSGLKSDISELEKRVSDLEKEPQVKFSGNANIYIQGVVASSDNVDPDSLSNKDGRVYKKLPDFSVSKEIELNVEGKINDKVNAYLKLVSGDYLSSLGGDDKSDEVIPYYTYVSYKDKKKGNAKFGRIPFQINPYVFQRYDDDSYVDNNRMDNGDYAVDGIDYNLEKKSFDFRMWFVKPQYDIFEDVTLSSNYNLDANINTFLGTQIGFNLFNKLDFDLLYSEARAEEDSSLYTNKSKVWGGLLNIPVGVFDFNAAYFTLDNSKYDRADLLDLKLDFLEKKLAGSIGYTDVDEGYTAPGNWELASVTNANNAKGFSYMLSYNFFDNFNFYTNYSYYDAKKYSGSKPKVDYYNAGFEWDMGAEDSLLAEYEYYKTDIDEQKSNYLTISWLREISENASFKLGYQFINDKFLNTDEHNKGGVLFGQFSASF